MHSAEMVIGRTIGTSLTSGLRPRSIGEGARNTSHKRIRPVSAVYVRPSLAGSLAEYNSLMANRRGLTYDRLRAPGTRAHGRRTGVGQRVA
jgi:hypothetical protein